MVWEVKQVSLGPINPTHDPLLDALNELTEDERIRPSTMFIDRDSRLSGLIKIYFYREDE